MMMKEYIKKIFIIVISIVFIITSFCVCAEGENLYCENSLWVETTSKEIDNKINNGEKFIVVFYRPECSKCKHVGTYVLSRWMDNYSYTIYGVNVDKEKINEWAMRAAGDNYTELPLVAFVDEKKVTVFNGAEEKTIEEMNKAFQNFSTPQKISGVEEKKTNSNNMQFYKKGNDNRIRLFISNLTHCSKKIAKKTVNYLLKITQIRGFLNEKNT